MGDRITITCDVCGIDLPQIGTCHACGHNQKNPQVQEDYIRYEEFDLPYGIESAPHALEEIRIPYGINHAPQL